MLGRHPGRAPSQVEILSGLFSAQGRTVRATSSSLNAVVRTADMFVSVLRWQRQVDIVMVNVFSGRAFLSADLITWEVRRLKRPLVLMLHGGGLPDFRRRYPSWVSRVMRRADHIVAPSPFLATVFADLDVPLSIIPNVIRLNEYDFVLRHRVRPRLLWMRAFSDIYRPWLAVEAVAQLLQRFPDAVLTMAGQPGPLLEPTRELAVRLGVADSVRFAGFLDMSGKAQAFEDHDIFITTSRVDNTPVSAVEAAAAGLPIVACAVGGIADLFRNDESALLVGTPDGLAGGIQRLIVDPTLAARLSTNGRKVAEAFDWPNVLPRWDALYESVLSARVS